MVRLTLTIFSYCTVILIRSTKITQYSQSYVGSIDNTNGTLTSSTTEFNFINSIIQPITVSRGQAFDSSISNVWRRTREIQIKNELAKRLPSREVSKKKKAKNVKQIAKHDDPKLKERRKLLQ